MTDKTLAKTAERLLQRGYTVRLECPTDAKGNREEVELEPVRGWKRYSMAPPVALLAGKAHNNILHWIRVAFPLPSQGSALIVAQIERIWNQVVEEQEKRDVGLGVEIPEAAQDTEAEGQVPSVPAGNPGTQEEGGPGCS